MCAHAGVSPRPSRFSLTELIVALVITAILGATLIAYFGSAVLRSADPARRLRETAALMSVAERITADYEDNYQNDLPSLRAQITQSSPPYGDYELVDSSYVQFDSDGNEQAGTVTDILKVKIRNGIGESLTLLFPYMP